MVTVGTIGSLSTVRVRLDHAATTPVRAEAAAALTEAVQRGLGNPSSVHASGRAARRALDDARDVVANFLGAEPGEVVFTSGGTEADDLAVNGVADARPGRLLCSAVEHDAVREPVLARGGSTVAVRADGVLDLDELERELRAVGRVDEDISLVSLMLVNNENGVRQPLDEAVRLVRDLAPGALVHTDAVQAAGWLDLALHAAAADLVSISGHKIGAPAGIGALVVRDGVVLEPRLRGGGQERERRSGTPNVAGAIALAVAVGLVAAERDRTRPRVAALRSRLLAGLEADIDGLVEPARSGTEAHPEPVGGTIQVCIPGVEGESLLFLLDDAGVEASAGSACAAGALDPSHVLAAMGVPRDLARGALRLSLGHTSTDTDVDRALEVIPAAVAQLRSAGRS